MFRIDCTFAAAFLLTLAHPASAAEIKVLSANALSLAAKPLGEAFTRETGHDLVFVFGSPGQVNDRLKAGEVYDLVILPTEAAAAVEQEGKWRPGTRHPLARVGIGIAVREGVKVDLSTIGSTRKALLEARTITLSDSRTGGLSGPNAQKVLAKLGIADTVKDKLVLSGNGQVLIATGDVDIGLYNVSEIPRAKGVVLAGPVPPAVQVYINYDAAVPATNAAPDDALALVRYFSRRSARPKWEQVGLELAGE